ncbi:MAG TPA: ABC transporter substrate-binding protein, partial [Acetobacteraceae bacterium]|nr:ABC transporter substrate-binding protein [Acetobacteraceae bacterium]
AETALSRAGVGFFPIGTPLANDAGLEAVTGPRDPARAKQLLARAGYKGERVVLLSPADFPVVEALAQVTRDVLVRCGMNVDYVSADWGTVISRRNSREPVERGGWSVFCTYGDGVTSSMPATNNPLRGDGAKAWFGWPTAPRMEELRSAWADATDLAAQRQLGEEMQRVAFDEVMYYPAGQWFPPTAFRSNVRDLLKSPFPIFWNARKTDT